jgi:hypothetical protein
LAEDYTIKIILPEGTVNPQIYIGDKAVDMSTVQKELSFGILDFEGRPTYILNHQGGVLKDKLVRVSYKYNSSSSYKKPFIIFVAVFSLLCLSIFFKRFTLQAFSHSKS